MTFNSNEIIWADNGSGYAMLLANNPIVFSITTGSNEFPSDASACEIIVTVKIGGYNGEEQKFSSEIGNSETVRFDIASAIREYYAKYEVGLSDTEYVIPEIFIYGHKSYLNEGEMEKTVSQPVLLKDMMFALRGGVSDYDIAVNGWGHPYEAVDVFKNKLTRMPSRPVVNVGDTFYKSFFSPEALYDYISNKDPETGIPPIGAFYNSVTTNLTTIAANTQSGLDFIVVNEANRQEFRFINSFGVIESISCKCLEEFAVDVKQVQHRVQGDHSFVPNGYSRNTTTTKNHWKMSSGFMSSDWLTWFAKEFLCAPRHWMRLKGTDRLIPVSVKVKEENTIYDKTKAEMNEVQFEVSV